MIFYFFLNNNIFENCVYYKNYKDIFKIDLRDLNLIAEDNNILNFVCFYPRTNIKKITSYTNFFFRSEPEVDCAGQISSKCFIHYGDSEDDYTIIDCDIYTVGYQLISLYIYLPKNNRSFLNELIYKFYPKITDECCICYETKTNIINIHQNEYKHFVCISCLVKIKNCPICREDLQKIHLKYINNF